MEMFYALEIAEIIICKWRWFVEKIFSNKYDIYIMEKKKKIFKVESYNLYTCHEYSWQIKLWKKIDGKPAT